jgi:hypothetical protein
MYRLFQKIVARLTGADPSRPPSPANRTRLEVESLEDRQLLSAIPPNLVGDNFLLVNDFTQPGRPTFFVRFTAEDPFGNVRGVLVNLDHNVGVESLRGALAPISDSEGHFNGVDWELILHAAGSKSSLLESDHQRVDLGGFVHPDAQRTHLAAWADVWDDIRVGFHFYHTHTEVHVSGDAFVWWFQPHLAGALGHLA